MKESPVVWHVGGEDVRMRIPLLLALRKRGFNLGAVGTESGEIFADHRIPYRRYTLDRWINPLADFRSFKKLVSLFRQHRPDIIHAFDTKPGIIGPAAAESAGIPARIRTVCGMGYAFSSESLLAAAVRPAYRFLQRYASMSSCITVFQNSDDQDYFLANRMVEKGADALVLSSGVDLEKLDREKPDAEKLARLRHELGIQDQIVITMITRMVPHKGVREFLEAARIIRKKHGHVCFLLVGPLASEGRQAVPRAEIDACRDDVKYIGRRNDVPDLLAVSDLFVLPSYYREGVPRVLLEAGAAGLPLITTDMPGCKEAVITSRNGWLVKPKDSRALSDAIRSALECSKQELRRMGKESRLHIEKNFTLENVADHYAVIYDHALKKSILKVKK